MSENTISSILNQDNSFIGNSSASSVSFGEPASSSLLDNTNNISITKWMFIIFILAFLGINIFVYLAKGTQDITNIFSPILSKITSLFGSVTGQIVDVSAEGAKGVVDTTANVIDTGLTAVQDITPGEPEQQTNTSIKSQLVKHTLPQPDIMQANTLNKALNNSKQGQSNNNDYNPDDSTSKIQGSAPKSGWCFIGEDRGFRACAKVGVNDTCMSGDIFPSQDICVNPNLRQ